jgi:hypothetical protein
MPKPATNKPMPWRPTMASAPVALLSIGRATGRTSRIVSCSNNPDSLRPYQLLLLRGAAGENEDPLEWVDPKGSGVSVSSGQRTGAY